MSSLVSLDVVDGLATLTLADEAHRNRISSDLMLQLGSELDHVATDATVRSLVLTAKGPVFCAGADLDGFGSDAPAELGRLLRRLAELPVPTIAAITGDAYGGGLGLIAACDLAVAVRGARFAFSEVRLGLTPAVIAEHCLRVMQPRPAAELMLSGERVDAEFMVAAGLLSRAVDDVPAMDSQVSEWVAAVQQGGPQALAVTKRVLREVPMLGAAAPAWSAEVSAERFASAEATEGVAAFRQRRLPDWAPERP